MPFHSLTHSEIYKERDNIMYVYFIRAGTKGPIKIGVAGDVNSRMDTLQTGNHMTLSIIAKIKCSSRLEAYDRENQLHKMFKHSRLRGEWFKGTIKLSKVSDIYDIERKKWEGDIIQQKSDEITLAGCPF
jgi:predicted GIY-YIG superfamily endonuclease